MNSWEKIKSVILERSSITVLFGPNFSEIAVKPVAESTSDPVSAKRFPTQPQAGSRHSKIRLQPILSFPEA